jgi:hypothetical protein
MKRTYIASVAVSIAMVILFIGHRIYTKVNYPNISDTLIFGIVSIDENAASRLDAYMDTANINKMIVFRLLNYDCSECKRYFTDLYINIRKKTDNVLLLSNFSGYRSVEIFKNTINITDPILNMSQMITKYDEFDSYTFIYVKGGTVECLYIPVKNNNMQNEQIIKLYLTEMESL